DLQIGAKCPQEPSVERFLFYAAYGQTDGCKQEQHNQDVRESKKAVGAVSDQQRIIFPGKKQTEHVKPPSGMMVRNEPKGKERTKIFRRAPLLHGDGGITASLGAVLRFVRVSFFSSYLYTHYIRPVDHSGIHELSSSPCEIADGAEIGVPGSAAGTPSRIHATHSQPASASAPMILDRGINFFSSPL